MTKIITRSLITSLLLASLWLPAHALAATAPNLVHMSATQKAAQQEYFRAHSFGFSQNFGHYHPGPHWVLKHQQQLKLTALQLAQETKLNNGMARLTIQDNQRLHAAYQHYGQDAAVAQPMSAHIRTDISAIGKAQTALAWEMVPYHTRGYALLTPAQQTIYHRLVDGGQR